MSGPNHLWSGDWQRESEAARADLDNRRVTPAQQPPREPSPSQAPPKARSARRRPSRSLSIVLVAVLILAGGAYGLTALLGSSGNSASPAPVASTPTLPPSVSPAVAPASPTPRPVSWLGMEIATVRPGAAVIETVKLGSAGDRAGLEPGDVILAINNHSINGASDIAPTIKGLPAGHQVSMQVSNGSTLQQTEITLAAPPSAYP